MCFAHDLYDLTDCEITQVMGKAHIFIRKHSLEHVLDRSRLIAVVYSASTTSGDEDIPA